MTQRILIVDDEESLRYTFELFLSDEGYSVGTADSYETALERLGEGWDVVFTDILLGGKSGVDLLRTLREKGHQCPVVMITGYPNVETAAEAVRLGAYDYLPKPVNQETLLRVTRMALRFKQLGDDRRTYRSNLEAIFRSVRDALITVDEGGKILDLNGAAQKICSLGRDAVGVPLRELPRECGGRCLDLLGQVLERREGAEVEHLLCGHPGRPSQVVNLCATPLLDERGEVGGAVLVVRDETRLHALERNLRERTRFGAMVGGSGRMQEIYELLDRLAQVPTTVLVTGDSGTGKELVADALHQRGPRRNRPLVKVNCAALSENLLESELFGYVRGAFTGAVRDGVGRFQKADGGTIFLDEIGDISPRLQVRLLRVLQEKVVERVGDPTPVRVDVRVVAATNQDLRQKIRRGEFREDLFYRLKVVNIHLPPLRERREDIPQLVEHFIEKYNVKLGKEIRSVSDEVFEAFMRHGWPGNIRELEHALEHAFILCRQPTISLEHLPPDLFAPRGSSPPPRCESAGDKDALRRALVRAGGNKAKAARLLGISRRTIYRKLDEFGIGTEDVP